MARLWFLLLACLLGVVLFMFWGGKGHQALDVPHTPNSLKSAALAEEAPSGLGGQEFKPLEIQRQPRLNQVLRFIDLSSGEDCAPSWVVSIVDEGEALFDSSEKDWSGSVLLPANCQDVVAVFENHLPVLVKLSASDQTVQLDIPVQPFGQLHLRLATELDLNPPTQFAGEFYSIGPTETPVGQEHRSSNIGLPPEQAMSLATWFPETVPSQEWVREHAEALASLLDSELGDGQEDFLYCPLIQFPLRKEVGSDVTWEFLPAPARYTWATPPGFQLMTPEAAEPSLQPWRGTVAIEPNSCTTLEFEALPCSSVSGRLAGLPENLESPTVIRLFRLLRKEKGEDSVDSSVQVGLLPSPDGSFRFGGLAPGEYKVLATSIHESQVTFFNSKNFHLDSGEDRDLGLIPSTTGHDVTIVTKFVGHEAVTLDADSVLQGFEDDRTVRLSIAQLRTPDPLLSIVEKLDLEVGKSVILKGLPAGRWGFKLKGFKGVNPVTGRPYCKPLENPNQILEIHQEGVVEFPFEIQEMNASLHISIASPPDCAPGLEARWSLVRQDGSAIESKQSLSLNATEGSSPQILEVQLEAGSYLFFVAGPSTAQGEGNPGWFAYRPLEIFPGLNEVQVDLEPGIAVRGQIVGPNMEPIPHYLAGYDVLLDDFPDGVSIEHYYGISDSEGAFWLQGVPPNARLLDRRTGQIVTPSEEVLMAHVAHPPVPQNP